MAASRPKRQSAGRRFKELVGEEADADELFWNQKAFQESSDDDSGFSSNDVDESHSDSSDSDISLPESEGEQGVSVAQERALRRQAKKAARKKKKNRYVDPALRALRAQQRTAGPRARNARISTSPRKLARAIPMSRSLRASTTTKSAAAIRSREVRDEMAKATAATRKPVVAPKLLTAEEVFTEAARTQLENTRALELAMRLEAAQRKQAPPKPKQQGPMIKRRSRIGCPNTITFTNVDAVPAVINARAPPPKPRAVCVITGKPARYKDPLTGLPYYDLGAFKAIRAQLANCSRGGGKGGKGAARASSSASASSASASSRSISASSAASTASSSSKRQQLLDDDDDDDDDADDEGSQSDASMS